jgi:hypothetical protein
MKKNISLLLFQISLITSLLFSSGCLHLFHPTSSRLLCSKDDHPFFELRHESAILKKSIRVTTFINSDDLVDKVGIYWGIHNPVKYPQELQKGTQIKFVEFWRTTDYLLFLPYKIRYEALFVTNDNPLPDDVYYHYTWGKGLYLHRAPWEDESVPESRYVGFNGRGYSPIKKDELQKSKP